VLDELGLTRLVAAAKYDRFGTGATPTAHLDSSRGRGTRSHGDQAVVIASALGHTDIRSTTLARRRGCHGSRARRSTTDAGG
jgi:hypothetical protein